MSGIWEKLMNDEQYQKLLNELPEEEREMALKSLKELVDLFENNLINPIKTLQSK